MSFSSAESKRRPGKSGTDAYTLFLRRAVPNHHPFTLRLFIAPVLLQGRLIFEMFCAASANALELFLGHLANFCEGHGASLAAIAHGPRKLFEFALDRFRCASAGK